VLVGRLRIVVAQEFEVGVTDDDVVPRYLGLQPNGAEPVVEGFRVVRIFERHFSLSDNSIGIAGICAHGTISNATWARKRSPRASAWVPSAAAWAEAGRSRGRLLPYGISGAGTTAAFFLPCLVESGVETAAATAAGTGAGVSSSLLLARSRELKSLDRAPRPTGSSSEPHCACPRSRASGRAV